MNTINTLVDFIVNDDVDHDIASADILNTYNRSTNEQKNAIDNFLIKLCGVTFGYLLAETRRREKTGLYKYSLQK